MSDESTRREFLRMLGVSSGALVASSLGCNGDPHLAPDDPCSHCNSGDPTLIVDLQEADGEFDWRGTFDIVLDE